MELLATFSINEEENDKGGRMLERIYLTETVIGMMSNSGEG